VTPQPERAGELGQARRCGDHADARDRPPYEGTRDPGTERGELGEQVVIPERGPRRDDEDETRLEEICREDETRENRDGQPSVSTLERRVTRLLTSR
jgi:hypothetical protein